MPSIVRDIEQAAIGCWMLVRGNAAGAQRLDLSIEGFWRSFRLAIPLAVLDALDALLSRADNSQDDGAVSSSVVGVLAFGAVASLLTFVLFPLIVGALAKPMGLSRQYPTYIIARNWLTLFLSLPVYVIDGLYALDLMSADLRQLLSLMDIGATLFACMMIARLLLGTARSLSFGFALLDLLLALLIGETTLRLIS